MIVFKIKDTLICPKGNMFYHVKNTQTRQWKPPHSLSVRNGSEYATTLQNLMELICLILLTESSLFFEEAYINVLILYT